jgi:hypothetical protein
MVEEPQVPAGGVDVLSPEQNRKLVEVGPGTLMGGLLR